MSLDVMDVLRLEVEDDPTGLVNLVQNPNGELGSWAWLTPLSSSSILATRDGGNLGYTRSVAGASYWTTEDLPVAAGEYAAAYWVLDDTGPWYVRARFEWYKADGSANGTSAQSAYYTGENVIGNLAPVVAPALTAKARLRFDVYANNAGANPGSAHGVNFKNVTVATAATAGALQTVRTNLFTNPSFETNLTGWESNATLSQVTMASPAGAKSLQAVATAAAVMNGFIHVSTPVASSPAVTGGQQYALSVRTRADAIARNVSLSVWWYDAGGALISVIPGAQQPNATGAFSVASRVVTAPLAAVKMRTQVLIHGAELGEVHYVDAGLLEQAEEVGSYFDGSTADAGGWDYAWTGTAHGSTSTATLSALQYIEPVPYLNVLGPTNSIKITRDELGVGLLNATILDATLDPAKADLLRPGRRVRVLALDPALEEWTPLLLGKARNATVAYDYKTPGKADAKRAKIELTASDYIAELAAPRAEGVTAIDELPYVLEGAGVPWSVNGSGNQVSAATIVARNPNATALDQVAITRDSASGYAWMDRFGVLQVWDAAEISTDVAALLDESTYTDLAIDYDTERCINTVTVKYLRFNLATGETVEVPYGPYVDQASVDQWGVRSADFTVQGIGEANVPAYAAAILAANATPVVRVNSVTLPVRTPAEVANALRDLYDLVTVSNVEAELEQSLRITAVEHTITANPKGAKWTTAYAFAADGGSAPPVPTAGVGRTAPGRVVQSATGAVAYSSGEATACSLTLAPGRWVLHAKGFADWSVNAANAYWNGIYLRSGSGAGPIIDSTQVRYTVAAAQCPVALLAVVDHAVATTYLLRAAPSHTGVGTQLLQSGVLVAIPID